MRRTLLSAASAAALSLALVAGTPILAQGLDDAAARGLAQLGVQAPPTESLSTAQVAAIQNVLSSTDADDVKRARIEQILGNEATATGRLGVRQLQSSVAEGLASLGIDAEGVEALSLEQLAQIENVMASSDADETKRARIGQIMAE